MPIAMWGKTILSERMLRRALIVVAVLGLTTGLATRVADHRDLANLLWMAATVPIAAALRRRRGDVITT
jgi:hypothetical protein